MMGWGPDNDLGKSFKEISHNDLILVAQRENWKFNYYFAGIVDGSSFFNDDGFQCLRIKHFVDLRNRNDDFLANVSFANAQTIKALMVIHDIEVINHLNIIIREKMEKEIIKKYCNLLKNSHNLILTGAPGTGKTYLAKQIAQQIIFGEIKKKMSPDEEKQFNEQCGFVQFHPSYDYTDFVEGLRPAPPQEDNDTMGFELKKGVFKEFCERAWRYYNGANQVVDFNDIYSSFVYDIVNNNIPNEFNTETQKRPFVVEVNRNGNLNVSPQTTISNYKPAVKKEFLKEYLENGKVLDWKSYTPVIGKYLRENYMKENNLKQLDRNAQFVFIIDEINRGEISKIFGELFYSIDPGYRGKDGKVRTQYANMQTTPNDFDKSLAITDSNNYGHFFVPENVYIIGTMNDIDRSVESMDFAFRRRFAFKEITAKYSKQMLDSDDAWGKDKMPKPDFLQKVKDKMDAINKVIFDDDEKVGIEGLSSAYHIGASYFLKLANYRNENGEYDETSFSDLWENHLEGLLLEYMRGMADVPKKIKKLANAYGYSKMNKYE